MSSMVVGQITQAGENGINPILEVKDLSVHFNKLRGTLLNRRESIVKAIDNVSFGVNQTESLAIVGESGSGKTTLARCIAGLNLEFSGSIKYRGQEVRRLRGNRLINYHKEVQMIFQDPFESLSPRESVFSIISTPLKLLCGENDKHALHEKVSKLLEEVGLNPTAVMFKLPHELSGGEKQRVSIARALAPNPMLLIADEPITMLDSAQRLNILLLLDRLKAERSLTVIIVTHDLASAKISADRVIIMYLGNIVEVGNAGVVLSKPYHPYTQLVLDSTPKLHLPSASDKVSEERDQGVSTTMDEKLRAGRGCIFNPRCKYATDICLQVSPQLLEQSRLHFAACHNPLNKDMDASVN